MQDSKKVIVIDDADILKATRLMLESVGYAVETAATAAEGMEKIRSGGDRPEPGGLKGGRRGDWCCNQALG